MTFVGIITSSIFALVVFGNICAKAGFPRWYGLLMAIPFLNVVVIVWLAFAAWPIEERLLKAEFGETLRPE